MIPQHFPSLPTGWKSLPIQQEGADPQNILSGILHHSPDWDNSQPHRLLFVLHGMGEHAGRYLHFPHYLQNSVSAVFLYDQRGHGQSKGIRGHVDHFDQLAHDAAHVVRTWHQRLAKERAAQVELHFLGHSMGGHVALRMLFLYPDLPLASATVTSPFLAVKAKVPQLKVWFAKTFVPVIGKLPLGTGLNSEHICTDPEVVDCYRKDPLVHGKMSPQFFVTMLESMQDTMARGKGIRVPLQVLVPLEDKIVDTDVTIQFFNHLEHSKKRLKSYPGFFHEPMNEKKKEIVFQDIQEWLIQHSSIKQN